MFGLGHYIYAGEDLPETESETPKVTAELGRAKLAGLMVDKKEIKHGRIDQMDRSEVESRLKALIDKNQLAPVLMEKVVSEEEVEEVEEVVEEDFSDITEEEAEIMEQQADAMAEVEAIDGFEEWDDEDDEDGEEDEGGEEGEILDSEEQS